MKKIVKCSMMLIFAVSMAVTSVFAVGSATNNTAAPAVVLPPPVGSSATPAASSAASPSTASASVVGTSSPSAPNQTNTPQVVPSVVPTVAPTVPVASTPKATSSAPAIIPEAPPVEAKAYILLDADSGYIIAQKNMEQQLPPASLTKLMTMYVVSGMLKSGRIHLTDPVLISENAWRTGGSRMFVQVGSTVPAHDLINGIIVASGNDACVAMAEHVAGNEASFVDLMNKTAAELGMKGTHYADATGLPNPSNYTTPLDLSILSRAIIYNYPEDYQWYSQKWMEYNNIRQPNRNLLLWRDPSVDGLKTGHTDDAGYCLVASAKRNNNMRLIVVVMGDSSTKQRATDALALLNYGYHFFETRKVFAKNTPLTQLRVWFGSHKTTPLGVSRDLYVTVPIGQSAQLKAEVNVQSAVNAPISKGQSYGDVQIRLNNPSQSIVGSQPLVALAENPTGGFFSRLSDHVSLFFSRWFHKVA